MDSSVEVDTGVVVVVGFADSIGYTIVTHIMSILILCSPSGVEQKKVYSICTIHIR